ncbi:hypothetical protein EMIT0210MI2_12312 [Priestia megaterium]
MKSFHATLKTEEVYHTYYTDYLAAKLAMFQFIKGGITVTESIVASAIKHLMPLRIKLEKQI